MSGREGDRTLDFDVPRGLQRGAQIVVAHTVHPAERKRPFDHAFVAGTPCLLPRFDRPEHPKAVVDHEADLPSPGGRGHPPVRPVAALGGHRDERLRAVRGGSAASDT